ncbi:MAG TPA: 30S ribosome-binding factor RbfA [Humisphaera sp.]
MSRRTEMLGSTIQRELAEYIMRELNDPRLPTIISITRVKVTEDLEYADVLVSIMGTPGQQTAALNALKHSAGLMRSRLTKSLSLRQAPFLRFALDEGLKKEMEVLEVLDRLRREREAAEAAKAAAEGAEAAGAGETGATDAPPAPGATKQDS